MKPVLPLLSALLLLVLLLDPVTCSSSFPGWNVGWGFAAGGGFPPLPASFRSWQLNRSTVGYFLGNASGMDSVAEVRAEVGKFGVVGIGWQLNNIPSKYSHLETFEIEEARKLKAMRPGVKVMVLRNTEVASVFWDSAKKVMDDPNTQDYWTQCGGKPCAGVWASPAGNTPKYFFNFSNPDLRAWWVHEYVGTALDNPLFDGVYYDCSCGSPPGDHLDQAAMQRAAQGAFDEVLAMATKKGKVRVHVLLRVAPTHRRCRVRVYPLVAPTHRRLLHPIDVDVAIVTAHCPLALGPVSSLPSSLTPFLPFSLTPRVHLTPFHLAHLAHLALLNHLACLANHTPPVHSAYVQWLSSWNDDGVLDKATCATQMRRW